MKTKRTLNRCIFSALVPILCLYGQYGAATQYPLAKGQVTLAIDADMFITERPYEVAETAGVNEMINGRRVTGTSHTRAHGKINMVPNDSYARFVLSLNGAANASTATHAGRATIFASSLTSIHATQGFSFNENGFWLERPAASCRTSSRITGVSARGPLVRRIALKRANREKASAEYASARSAERRVSNRVFSQVAEQVAKPNKMLNDTILPALKKADLLPRIFSRSGRDWLSLAAAFGQMRSSDRISAAPEQRAGTAVQLNIHPILLKTLGNQFLKGSTLTGEQIATFAEVVYGNVPPELRIQEHRELWAFNLADQDPVEFHWVPNRHDSEKIDLTVILNLKNLSIKGTSQGDGIVDEIFAKSGRNIVVRALYTSESLPTGPHFRRNGEVEISGAVSPDVQTEAFMHAKFDGLLGPSVYFDGLAIPAGLGGDNFSLDRLRTLKMSHFAAANEWLTIGWGNP